MSRGLILGMHGSFAGLFLTLLGLWVLTDFNGHVLALTAIALCLWATTGWYVLMSGPEALCTCFTGRS
jgi:hypothetical protein